jgi:hypothetical protein
VPYAPILSHVVKDIKSISDDEKIDVFILYLDHGVCVVNVNTTRDEARSGKPGPQ